MHGHNWKVEVEVCGNKLDNIGMVIDFKEIRNMTKSVVDQLDHRFLNDLKPFKEINPTAENIARYIHKELSVIMNDKQIDSVLSYIKSHWEDEIYERQISISK